MRSGLIRSFLAGMIVALIFAGAAGFWVYKAIQAKLSPPAIRKVAEESLSNATSHPVSVGDASLSLVDKALVFRDIRISVKNENMLTIERIDARADGVKELNNQQFVELIVTKPTIALRRDLGQWNLESFLKPIVEKMSTASVPGATPESTTEKKPIPLTHVQITDAELTIVLEDGNAYSGANIGNLDLKRESVEAPWEIRVDNSQVRLNPSEGEWPLLEVVDLIKKTTRPGGDSGAPETDAATEEKKPLKAIGTVTVENIDFEFIHPQSTISLEGFSFEASQFFDLIRAQTGTLEKKTPPPAS